MNENLNLVEILKNVPKGTKLWSPLYGDCEFVRIKEHETDYPIICLIKYKDGSSSYAHLTVKGEYDDRCTNCECVLFPSRENRDWSTFKVPKKHKEFKPFQKVLVKEQELVGESCEKLVWLATEYSHYDEDLKQHYCTQCHGFDDDDIIPYEGNEDKLGKSVKS